MSTFENELRASFERMHKGRRLTRHHLRGTYSSPQIAALWNQHVKTAELMKKDPRALQIEQALRNLLATIELHTDCMDGRIDRAALDPWIEKAEDLLGETIEEIIE